MSKASQLADRTASLTVPPEGQSTMALLRSCGSLSVPLHWNPG